MAFIVGFIAAVPTADRESFRCDAEATASKSIYCFSPPEILLQQPRLIPALLGISEPRLECALRPLVRGPMSGCELIMTD